MKRFLLVAGLATVLALGFLSGGGTPAKANPGGLQNFNLDMTQCLVPLPDNVSPNPLTGWPQNCLWASEVKTLGPSVGGALGTSIGLIGGNRLGYPYVYTGPGMLLQGDEIPDLTQVGDVVSVTDIFQNGVVDVMADVTNCGGGDCSPALTFATAIPEQYIKKGAFTATSGCSGADELYMNALMPGAGMTRYVRYLACIDTLYLGGAQRFNVVALTGVATPLNLVTYTPNWSPAGTHVDLIVLSQLSDHLSPNAALLGLDTPQASLSHVYNPYASNPGVAGLYAMWITEISAPDLRNGALNFTLSTSCKAIGGAYVDADSDCAATVANPGGPADTNDANPDQDGDGLLDGIEAAWGSNPLVADTDGDGRSDLEEMIGPTQFLTNPTNADTDADTVPDGGYKVDGADVGLAPDFPDVDGDGVIDAGISADQDNSADGSSHVRTGYKIVGTDILPDAAGKDNCPTLAGAQTNTDLDALTTLGAGDLYGDVCDVDNDNDEIVDDAEATFKWQPVGGAITDAKCSNVPPMAGPATPLNPLDPDTDGDGILDGVECKMGSNPLNATDVPEPCSAGPMGPRPDADLDRLCWANGGIPWLPLDNEEVHYRTDGISGNAPFGGDTIVDSDGDTLKDGCEVLIAGMDPMNPDSDGDTVADGAEVVGASAGTPGRNACSAPTTEYTAMGNGASIAGNDSTIANSKGGRTADTDKDGLLNYADVNPAGDPPVMDITYDDNGNGVPCFPPTVDGADNGPSWDADCNGRLDGWAVGTCGSSSLDADGDGLKDAWENCKWGTNPNIVDSDSDGAGDCKEALDSNGNGTFDFGGDVLNMARAALLPAGTGAGQFGRDGVFDLNGNNGIGFGDDVLTAARMAFKVTGYPCL